MAGFSAEETTPLEALTVYLKSKKTSVEPKVLLEYGERLIQESKSDDPGL